MLLHYLRKLKTQIFCRCQRKQKQIAFLIASNFVIHPQISTFPVFRYYRRRVFISRLCPGLFVSTCAWNVSRCAVHRSWQMRTALLAWSALSLLLPKFPQSATDFVFFTDEKMFSVASPEKWQNDRVYAPRDTRKCSIAAERLLRCSPTFSKSLMVSVAVSKLGCSPLFFVQLGVTVDGR